LIHVSLYQKKWGKKYICRLCISLIIYNILFSFFYIIIILCNIIPYIPPEYSAFCKEIHNLVKNLLLFHNIIYRQQNTNFYWGPYWSYGSWIYNYLCNQGLSQLKLCVRTPLRQGIFDATLWHKVCQRLATGLWCSLVSSTIKLKYCWNWH
jgi:hypothetical protein